MGYHSSGPRKHGARPHSRPCGRISLCCYFRAFGRPGKRGGASVNSLLHSFWGGPVKGAGGPAPLLCSLPKSPGCKPLPSLRRACATWLAMGETVRLGVCHWGHLGSSVLPPHPLLEAILGPCVLQEHPVCYRPTEHLFND